MMDGRGSWIWQLLGTFIKRDLSYSDDGGGGHDAEYTNTYVDNKSSDAVVAT